MISQLITNLDKQRFHSEIACLDGEVGELGEKLQARNTKIHVFQRGSGFDLNLIRQLKVLLKVEKYDVVHCHQYTPFVYGMFASLFSSSKVVFTEHGRFHPDSYSWKRRLVNPLLGLLTHSIVAISAATKQALVKYEWFSKHQIEVIYNGLQPFSKPENTSQLRHHYGIPDGSVVFGTIARFDSIKNIPLMIKAFEAVSEKLPEARLFLIGDGGEREKLEQLVQERNLEKTVFFTGFQQNTAEYMSLIDVYLLTSFSEGTSMTLLEAMSSGTCSIVTKVGGNVELIEHDKNGVVIESDDEASLVKWMLELADDETRRTNLGQAGSKVFNQKFSIMSMIDGYSSTYEKVTGLKS